jgi:hypothetical protein
MKLHHPYVETDVILGVDSSYHDLRILSKLSEDLDMFIGVIISLWHGAYLFLDSRLCRGLS